MPAEKASCQVEKGLILRNEVYYARVRVPKELVKLVGRRELKKSLDTRRLPEARRRLHKWQATVQHYFMEARMAELNRQLATQYAHDNLNNRLDQQEVRRLSQGPVVSSVNDALITIHQTYKTLSNLSLTSNQLIDGAHQAQALLVAKGHPADAANPAELGYLALCHEMLKSSQEFHAIEVERLHGNYDNEYDRIRERAATAGVLSRATMTSLNDLAPGGDIETLIELYMRDNAKKWRKKTVNALRHSLGVFVKVAGKKDVTQYVSEDFIKYKESLAMVPVGITRRKEFIDKDLLALVAEVKCALDAKEASPYKLLDLRTQDTNLERIGWFFNWLVEKNYLMLSFAKKLGYGAKALSGKTVREHKDPELQKIVDSLPIQATNPEKFFIPLLGVCRS